MNGLTNYVITFMFIPFNMQFADIKAIGVGRESLYISLTCYMHE